MPTIQERLEYATEYLKTVLQLYAPIDTAALMSHGIKVVDIAVGKVEILIGGGTIDYAIYTNEPWIDERWGGKQNPNQGWIDRAIEQALPLMQQIMSGAVEINDLSIYSEMLNRNVQERRLNRLRELEQEALGNAD